MVLPKSQKGLTPVILVIVVAVALAGGYFVYNNFNQPAIIKEKSTTIQPLFQDFKRSVEDIGEHLNETPSGNDADSRERYAQKGENIVKTGADNLEKLRAQTSKFDSQPAQDYKKKLTDYIAKAEELIKYEKDNIKIGKDYDTPLRDYEQLTKDISGVSVYIYSDPARYVKEVNDAISKEDKIIRALESLNEEGIFKKSHDSFIKTLKTERIFLKEVSEAVGNRDNNAFRDATKKYDQASKDDAKESNRVEDEAKEKYKAVVSDLKSLADQIDRSYSDLKEKFKF